MRQSCHNCCGFLTIFDNVLAVGKSTSGEERAGLPHPHPGGLIEGEREGVKNCGAADFIEAFQH